MFISVDKDCSNNSGNNNIEKHTPIGEKTKKVMSRRYITSSDSIVYGEIKFSE